MSTAAELVVKVSADTASAETQLMQFANRLGSGGFFGQAAATMSGMLGAQIVGGAIRGVSRLGGTIVGLGADAISTGADFSASMDAITAVLGGTSAEAEKLGEFVLSLGMNPMLKVGVDEAAAAVEVLATQGATADEIMGGLAEQTILLANSTGGELTDAANVTSDAINLFGLGVSQAADIVNGATGVINQSKFDINDYAYALANGGATASQFGVSLDDFNTVIAGTSNSFVRGQTAGTAFSTMLTRLVPASGPAADAMRELGWITDTGSNIFFDATGNLKSMNEIVGILHDSLSGLSDQERIDLATQIFGTQGMDSALALSKMTRAEYEALKISIADTSAYESAKTRTDNLQSAWETLGDTVTAAKIKFGAALEEPLAEIVRSVQPVIEMAEPVIEWAGETIAQVLADWSEPIIQQVKVGLETYVYLTDTMGMSPGDAARAAISAALETDTISLGPVNYNITTGNITWGGQKAESFAGYAVSELWASFQRQMSTGLSPSGFQLGTKLREMTQRGIEEAGFGDMPFINGAANLLVKNINDSFAAQMDKIDAASWLDETAANFATGVKEFFGVVEVEPEVIVTPTIIGSPMEMGLDAYMAALSAQTYTVSPRVVVTPQLETAVGAESAREIVNAINFAHGIETPDATLRGLRDSLMANPPTVPVTPIVTTSEIDVPTPPSMDVQPFIPSGFNFGAATIAPPKVEVQPVFPTAFDFKAAKPPKVEVQPVFGPVPPGSIEPIKAPAVVNKVEWGSFTNPSPYPSGARIGDVDWGSHTHTYNVTAVVTQVNGLPGGTGAAAGGQSATAQATGSISTMGGWSLVGERGPELVRLPAASRVWTNGDTESMLGGPQVVVNAVVNSPLDEESLVRRIRRELQRGA